MFIITILIRKISHYCFNHWHPQIVLMKPIISSIDKNCQFNFVILEAGEITKILDTEKNICHRSISACDWKWIKVLQVMYRFSNFDSWQSTKPNKIQIGILQSISSTFYASIFCTKFWCQKSQSCVLGLKFFGEKILAQKTWVKCWWKYTSKIYALTPKTRWKW